MKRRELDRFGGWTGKKFKATGFFRVEKDERWWLVTPEGSAFLSFGINHLHPDLWKQDYNRQAWKKRLGLDDLNSHQFAPAIKAWFLQTCCQYGFNTVGVHTALPIVNSPQPLLLCLICNRFILLIFHIGNRRYRQQFQGCLFRRVHSALRWDGKETRCSCKE